MGKVYFKKERIWLVHEKGSVWLSGEWYIVRRGIHYTVNCRTMWSICVAGWGGAYRKKGSAWLGGGGYVVGVESIVGEVYVAKSGAYGLMGRSIL